MPFILAIIIGLAVIWSVYLFSLRGKKSTSGSDASVKTPELDLPPL